MDSSTETIIHRCHRNDCYKVGSRIVHGEGTAIMLRNALRAKGEDPDMVCIADTIVKRHTFAKFDSDDEIRFVTDDPDKVYVEVPGYPTEDEWADLPILSLEPHVTEDPTEVVDLISGATRSDLVTESGLRRATRAALETHTVIQLRKEASKLGLKGAYKGPGKSELIDYILNHIQLTADPS